MRGKPGSASMSDQHDYVALEWVKDEIADTLRQARQALDGLDEPEHAGQNIAECLACIHQVHGSLQMVEFYGAALLAEEMEQLVLAMQEGRVSEPAEAVSLLHQAFAQLPLYLERVHSARRDLPLVVLPLLNDLRSARGESRLSETSLFSPALLELPPLDAQALAELAPAELPGLLRKWRQMLQTALVGLLREQDDATNLGYMAKVFSRLEGLCQGAPLAPLWQVGSALVEGITPYRANARAQGPLRPRRRLAGDGRGRRGTRASCGSRPRCHAFGGLGTLRGTGAGQGATGSVRAQ